MEGRSVKSKGSMSCGAAAEGLTLGKDTDGGKAIEYQISIPGGSKGAGMYVGYQRLNGWGGKQREFMTNRDSWFKVGKSHYDKGRDIIVTEIEWVGLDAHDYGKKRRSRNK